MSERILIVKIAALGDAIMASAMIPAIRREWPNATVGWVAGRSIAPVVELFEGVDEVIAIDDSALLRGNKLQAIRALAKGWQQIGRRWDRAIVAHSDKRYALLAKWSGARTLVRFADDLAPRRGRWHGSEYHGLVGAVRGGESSGDSTGLVDAERYATFRVPTVSLPLAIDGDERLIVIAPGGARNVLRDDHLRRWPLEAWVEATSALLNRGFRVAIVGTNADRDECKRVAETGAVDLSGQLSLTQLTTLLQRADVAVTHDSGPLHLSLALGRPVVALFGPTPPDERIPTSANAIVLTRAHELPCAPCYDGKNFADCALNLCLQRVPAFEVVDAVEQLLNASQISGNVSSSK